MLNSCFLNRLLILQEVNYPQGYQYLEESQFFYLNFLNQILPPCFSTLLNLYESNL